MQIIIALDNMSFDKSLELTILLGDFVDGFKINHTLLEHTSMFENYEGELFIDFKLWDTPATVCSVVEMILKKGATMTTISTFNNDEVFKDLHQYSEDIKLLGVTYLTSWSDTEQYKIVREPKSNMWDRNLKRIRKSGFSGIVCSAQDIKDIEEQLSKPDLYKLDKDLFIDLTKNLQDYNAKLESSEERWVELMSMKSEE
jgi:orotidine-5'-phosphate decarboxylase